MPKIFKNLFFTFSFLLFSIITSYAQNKIKIPAAFVETTPPKVWSDKWYSLNNAKNAFKVEIKNAKLSVEKTKYVSECELKIENGTLKGSDGGEFGGKLTFVPDDKTKSEVKISRGNIKFIFRLKDKIYFITGILHMTFNMGAISELTVNEGVFTTKTIIEFDNAPQAYAIYRDKLFIASDKNFYVIKDLKKQILFKDLFWEGLYPNSIAVFNNENVFVGIRSGIVKLNLNKRSLKFYKNKE